MKTVDASTDQQSAECEEEYRIIRTVLAGEQSEFRKLVSMYRNMIFALIIRQVGQHEVAEDLAQEVFMKAYKNLKSFRFESQFSTWLTRIALNHTNSYFSSKKYKTQRRQVQLDTFTEEFQNSQTPEKTKEQNESILRLQQALSNLKPALREVLVLCGLEGKSYKETAAVLDIPVGTVRSRLHKARLLAKEAFLNAGGEL